MLVMQIKNNFSDQANTNLLQERTKVMEQKHGNLLCYYFHLRDWANSLSFLAAETKKITLNIFAGKVLVRNGEHQGCGVGRFFMIPTPSHKLFKFKKSTPTPHFFKTDSGSSIFENPTPTPAFVKNRHRLQVKTCDSTDSDSTTLVSITVDTQLAPYFGQQCKMRLIARLLQHL